MAIMFEVFFFILLNFSLKGHTSFEYIYVCTCISQVSKYNEF